MQIFLNRSMKHGNDHLVICARIAKMLSLQRKPGGAEMDGRTWVKCLKELSSGTKEAKKHEVFRWASSRYLTSFWCVDDRGPCGEILLMTREIDEWLRAKCNAFASSNP